MKGQKQPNKFPFQANYELRIRNCDGARDFKQLSSIKHCELLPYQQLIHESRLLNVNLSDSFEFYIESKRHHYR